MEKNIAQISANSAIYNYSQDSHSAKKKNLSDDEQKNMLENLREVLIIK